MHDTIKNEKKIGDDIKIDDNPEITTFFCKICKQNKSKENYHKFIKSISSEIFCEKYINHLCKDCLPIEALYWNANESEPRINQNILNNHYHNKELIKLKEEYGLIIGELISRSKVLKILNLQISEKDWLINKVKMGLIKEFKIGHESGNFSKKVGMGKTKYQLYYLPQEIELMKYIKENGFLIVRGQNSVKMGDIGKHNPPYHFINKNGKHYLFVNLKDKKKSCVICCQYKDFDEFNASTVTKDKKTNVCNTCTTIRSKIYYRDIPKEEKENKKLRAKEWVKQNKDKIKLYRRIRAKKIENRVSRNIRRRVSRAICDKINCNGYFNPTWYVTKDYGCNKYELIKYLESKLLPGMTWENYGPGYKMDENNNNIKIKQWQIDHIKPISSFNLNDNEEIKKINHYTNLLPMWADDNEFKSDKTELCPILDKEFLEKYKELEILIKDNYDNH